MLLAIDLGHTDSPADGGLMSLVSAEKALIDLTLKHFDYNVSQAADSLGISRGALYRRMDDYKIARTGN